MVTHLDVADDTMRVLAISDIHVDYPENMKWVQNLSDSDYIEDVLILAGDVTDETSLLEKCFRSLVKKFSVVMFVPGNHELWVTRDNNLNSLEKFDRVIALARDCGVCVDPLESDDLSIVPLHGWYDFSFAKPCESIDKLWSDFRACKWPKQMSLSDVCRFFVEKNQENLQIKNKVLISFSHFLPRIDVMPFYIPTAYRYVYPVLGSAALGQQVNEMRPSIHIYGHSHVNQRITLNGVRYINNAFGYPSETGMVRRELLCVYER